MKKLIVFTLSGMFLVTASLAQSLYPVKLKEFENKIGFIDKTGKLIVSYQYDYGDYFYEGLGRVIKGGKTGFIDHTGKVVIPMTLENATNFTNGYAYILDEGVNYFMDKTGKKYEVDNAWSDNYSDPTVSNGLILIQNAAERFGYINLQNELIIPAEYTRAEPFNNGYALVIRDRMYYLIDTLGNETAVASPDKYPSYNGETVSLYLGNKEYEYFNTKMESLYKLTDHQILKYNGDYAVFSENDLYGLMDKSGKKVMAATHKFLKINDGMIFTSSDYINLTMYNNQLKVVKKFSQFAEGVGGDLRFHDQLSLIHFIKNDPESDDEMVRDWGGVMPAYIDRTGKIVWQGDVFYSCFPGDALVSMADGTTKPIREIKKGDQILSRNNETGSLTTAKVNLLQVHDGKFNLLSFGISQNSGFYSSLAEMELTTQCFLRVTPNHPVLTNQGIKTAGAITTDDLIYLYNTETGVLEESYIISISEKEAVNKVYNLQTDATNYLINGVVVMRK